MALRKLAVGAIPSSETNHLISKCWLPRQSFNMAIWYLSFKKRFIDLKANEQNWAAGNTYLGLFLNKFYVSVWFNVVNMQLK